MEEQWKPIDGMNGVYISNFGRVKKKNGFTHLSMIKNYMCFPYNQRWYPIHRFVAKYFLENPNNYPIVKHINGDRSNNNVDNLEWVKNYCPSEERIGETQIGRGGVVGEIIGYNKQTYLYSVLLHNKSKRIIKLQYGVFKRGEFGHNPIIKKDRTGERYISSDGYWATIVEYNSNKDYWIQFDGEDQKIHKAYSISKIVGGNFRKYKKAKENNYNYDPKLLIGKTNYNTQGYKMTILNYHNPYNIDVIFDDGKISEHRVLENFEKGQIPHPVYYRLTKKRLDYLRSTNIIKDVVRYHNMDDMAVELLDGTVIENTTYYECIQTYVNIPDENSQTQKRKMRIPKTKESSEGRIIREILHAYKRGAIKRGIDFNLSIEQFRELIKQPCYYTGIQFSNTIKRYHGKFNYNGLDRIDPKKGYTIDNVVPCCKEVNRAKQDLSINDFISMCESIVNNKSKILELVRKIA